MAEPNTKVTVVGNDPVIRTWNIRIPGTATSAAQKKVEGSGTPFADIARAAMHRLGVLFSRGSCVISGGQTMDDGSCTNTATRPSFFGPNR